MAILFRDTPSYYANTTQAQQGIYNTATLAIITSSLPAGMIESTAWQNPGNNATGNFIALPSPGAGAFIFGARIYFSSLLSGNIVTFTDGSKAIQVGFQLNANGSISAYRTSNANILGTTAAGIVSAGSVNYFEFKVLCDASAGTVDLHLNGVSVLSLTGQNTKGQSTTTIGFINVIGPASITTYFQSIYVADTTGSSPTNTFLGDIRIWTRNPNADGHYIGQYVANGAANVFGCVDQTTPDDDTTYASDSTPGDEFSVTYPSGTISGSILEVAQVSRVRKDDAGTTRQIQQLARSSTTDSLGSTQTLGTSFQYYVQSFSTDPATGVAWTNSGVNGIETGLKTIA